MLDGKHVGRGNLNIAGGRSDMRARHTGSRAARGFENGRLARGEMQWCWRPKPVRDQASFRTLDKSTAGVIRTHRACRAHNLLGGPPDKRRENRTGRRFPALSKPCVGGAARLTRPANLRCFPRVSPGEHHGLFDSNRSMICFFSFDETLGGGTAGGVMPAGPTPPTASLTPAVGFAESRPMLATKPLPGVMSV